MTVEVYKCYLVEVVDGNDIVYSGYHFTDRKDALRIGQEEKERIVRKRKDDDKEELL